ncbi:glutathione S-transferase, partial [Chytridium lagenaria]
PILLEELNIPYDMHFINFATKDQFKPEFLKIVMTRNLPFLSSLLFGHSPKQQIPAIPGESCERISGLGPIMGQRGHFTRYAPEKIPYAINRFSEETERLFKVMETRLSEVDYFNGHGFSIADIAIFPWASAYEFAGIDIAAYPNFKKWLDRVASRPGVKAGLAKVENLGK